MLTKQKLYATSECTRGKFTHPNYPSGYCGSDWKEIRTAAPSQAEGATITWRVDLELMFPAMGCLWWRHHHHLWGGEEALSFRLFWGAQSFEWGSCLLVLFIILNCSAEISAVEISVFSQMFSRTFVFYKSWPRYWRRPTMMWAVWCGKCLLHHHGEGSILSFHE